MSQTGPEHSRTIRTEGRMTTFRTGGGDIAYGLGLIGALIYFVQHANGFWEVILAVLKAVVWPAFLVYELMRSVGL